MDGPGAAGGVGGAGAQVVHAYDVIQDLQVAVSVGWSAGPGDALPSFLDVLEQEAEGRRDRRINRLGKESRLPSGKTWEILGHDRMPPGGCGRSWTNWPRAASWIGASTSWPSVLPGPEGPRLSSTQPTGWCRRSSRPSATVTRPVPSYHTDATQQMGE